MTALHFAAVLQFADAVYRDIGVEIEPVADSELHRFDCPKGWRGNRACWYVLHLDGIPAGAYGNWKTSEQFTWRAKSDRPITPEERERTRGLLREVKRNREQARQVAQEWAACDAQTLWELSKPAAVDHPYLTRKRIPGLCLRQRGDVLLVPLGDVSGNMVNLQRIFPDGTKRFLKGGRITGAFWMLGRKIPDTGTLYIAEGVATAATIAHTLRQPTVAAMNAGNLKPVARVIRAQYPNLELVIAADDDHRTPGNPGITKAQEAARAVGGGIVRPQVCGGEHCRCSDFNDVTTCRLEVSHA